MLRIEFLHIESDSSGLLRCYVVREGNARELTIQLPNRVQPAPDLIALALSTLAGRHFKEIRIDVPLSTNDIALIESFTNATVEAPHAERLIRDFGSSHVLSFSGGLDSLAALALVPISARLISVDFGGRFARERPFFSQFEPYIVETNLVQLGLNRNHWSFMLVGVILLRDELDIGTYSFGAILGQNLRSVLSGVYNQRSTTLPLLQHVGVSQMNPVAGLTEVGTALLAARTRPGAIKASVASLAKPGEEKAFRKATLIEAISERHNLHFPPPPTPPVRPWFSWGDYPATDLSSLYVLKVLGRDRLDHSYVGGIPDYVIDAVPGLDLEFYERVNPDAYQGLTVREIGNLCGRMSRYGIGVWRQRDWQEAHQVQQLIDSASE